MTMILIRSSLYVGCPNAKALFCKEFHQTIRKFCINACRHMAKPHLKLSFLLYGCFPIIQIIGIVEEL